jgi:tetratricopeptide (TPR) repeat protein
MDVFTQNDRKYVRKGNSSYKEGNYQQAEVDYRKALERDPSSYKADFNLGNAMYKQEQYDAAAGRYSALAEKETDHEKLSRYYYNLGNTMFESQKYKESIEAYKMALRNNPADMDAKHNLQLALQYLREQQEQQQNKDNQQGGDNQNEQKKDQNEEKNQDPKQDQQKNDQNQGDQNNDAQNPPPQKGEITPEDAERILQALENEEKEVMKKVQERKEQSRKVPVDKNW